MESEEKLVQEETWHAPKRAYIGFTVFDLIHIFCGVSIIVRGGLAQPLDVTGMAEGGVIIVLSMVLMSYIAVLARPSSNHSVFHGVYAFAWLVATAALIVPSLFDIPEIMEGGWQESLIAAYVLEFTGLILALVIFTCASLSLFTHRQTKAWTFFMHATMIVVLVLCVVLFVGEFFVEMDPFERVLNCLEDVAPLTPAILGLTLFRSKNF